MNPSALQSSLPKSDIATVDGGEILDQVATLTIARWSFASVPNVRHMGPMAQDFHAAFELGNDPTRLSPMDVQGVALAAIQGLNAKVEGQAREIAELRRTVDLLLSRLAVEQARSDH